MLTEGFVVVVRVVVGGVVVAVVVIVLAFESIRLSHNCTCTLVLLNSVVPVLANMKQMINVTAKLVVTLLLIWP